MRDEFGDALNRMKRLVDPRGGDAHALIIKLARGKTVKPFGEALACRAEGEDDDLHPAGIFGACAAELKVDPRVSHLFGKARAAIEEFPAKESELFMNLAISDLADRERMIEERIRRIEHALL